MLTASVALAPSRLLFSLPSRSIRVRSRKACSLESRPRMSTIALILFLLASAGGWWRRSCSGVERLLEERPRLDRAVELGKLLEEGPHVLERHRVRSVGERLRRIRMRLHEDAGDADR